MSLTPYVVKPATYYCKKLINGERHCRYNVNEKLIGYVENINDAFYVWPYRPYKKYTKNKDQADGFSSLEQAKDYLDNQLKLEGYTIFERAINKWQFKKLKALL